MTSVDHIATKPQRDVMEFLAQQAHGYRLVEAPFVTLPEGTWSKTITALLLKDFIMISTLRGKPEYKITSRGLKALDEIAQTRAREAARRIGETCRTEGCHHPPYTPPSGVKRGYCLHCINAQVKRLRRARRYNPDTRCQCGGRRYVTPNGIVRPHCLTCWRERNRLYKARSRMRALERLEHGETIPCRRCGDPAVKSGRCELRLCRGCLHDQYAREWRRHKQRRIAKRLGLKRP